ncbi:hypothetical protein L9F63_022531, partial [Diploptera punctata]
DGYSGELNYISVLFLLLHLGAELILLIAMTTVTSPAEVCLGCIFQTVMVYGITMVILLSLYNSICGNKFSLSEAYRN